jgi:branched-chain amino acid transport system substrate-binding protein
MREGESMRGKRRFAAATAVALAMVGTMAACGGDDSDSGASSGTTATTAASSGGSSTTAGSTATTAAKAQPASMDEWEKLWADQRAVQLKRIKDNKWGTSADGKTVTGPEGFTMDLSKCPAGWSQTEGLTDTEIKIGAPTPLSGTAADSGNWTRGAGAWFNYQADRGLFKDSLGKTRKVNLIMKDDGYDAARTIPIVDELMDSDKVFALWTLGTPSGLKIYDKINQRCVPQPVLISGSPAWGDPVNHPWTSGSLLSYSTEAVIWGAFIDNHIAELTAGDGKATIAALITNSDFGATYDSSFRAVIAQSPNKDKIEFVTEKLEITAPTVTDPMTTLASKNPDMFITMTGATQCPQIINEVANNGMKQKTKFLFFPSVCKASSYISKDKVGGDGTQSNGWYIVGGGFKDFNSDSAAADPFVAAGRKILADNGLDYKTSGSLGQGFYFGWLWGQILAVAGQMDGGLTRSNVIVAQRTIDGTSPVHLPGIKINMDGNADAYNLEGSDLSVWDAAQQKWVVQGDIIELSGKSKNCSWDVTAAACR